MVRPIRNAPEPLGPQPYLQGNFAPVADEIDADATELRVEGEIPAALHGAYYRNGANPAFAPLGAYHIFEGDGMVHGVWLEGGRAVHYRNRWVRSAGLELERRHGKAIYHSLSEVKFPGPEYQPEAGVMKNAANTNIVGFDGQLLALYEGSPATALDYSLNTVGLSNFRGSYAGGITAHPKFDPATGEMRAFNYQPFPPYLHRLTFAADGTLLRNDPIEVEAPIMVHDFAVTDDYDVFLDAPAIFDVARAMEGRGPIVTWEPERGARFKIVPRQGDASAPITVEVEPGYVFHFANAYTDGDMLVVEGSRFADLPVSFTPEENPDDTEASVPYRYEIDLVSGIAKETQYSDLRADFPRIDDRFAGRKTRYTYFGASTSDRAFGDFDQICAHDRTTDAFSTWRMSPASAGGEFVFAPDPTRAGEGEGWLVGYIYDDDAAASYLAILDATDVAAGPIAKVWAPRRIPFGFHGNWVPAVDFAG